MNNYGYPEDSKLKTTEKQKSTPYYRSYLASLALRPARIKAPKVVEPITKRTFALILIIILMVAIIGVYGASFVGVLPFGLYEKIGVPPEIVEIDEEEGDIENVGIVLTEEEADEEVEEEKFVVGADDIIYSLLKSFSMDIPEDQSIIFYRSALMNVDDVETPVMIGIYLVPISIILSIVTAIFILVKAIIGLTSNKRRKFPYLSLVLLLFTLLGVAGGFVCAAQPVGEITSFLFMSGANLVMGLGLLAIIGIEVVALILSFVAYKSKAKCAPYYVFEDGSTLPIQTK